ncbi:hypothetical protein ACP4OV_011946 [Aristida adscensionis]
MARAAPAPPMDGPAGGGELVVEVPELPDDVISEILLRLPPWDPHCLGNAAGVCKAWSRIVCDPAFHRRYDKFHRERFRIIFAG